MVRQFGKTHPSEHLDQPRIRGECAQHIALGGSIDLCLQEHHLAISPLEGTHDPLDGLLVIAHPAVHARQASRENILASCLEELVEDADDATQRQDVRRARRPDIESTLT